MCRFAKVILGLCLLSIFPLFGCQDLVPHNVPSLLDPTIQRSEIVGIVAGFGTTFAAAEAVCVSLTPLSRQRSRVRVSSSPPFIPKELAPLL